MKASMEVGTSCAAPVPPSGRELAPLPQLHQPLREQDAGRVGILRGGLLALVDQRLLAAAAPRLPRPNSA